MSDATQELPKDDPRVVAWNQYQQSESYADSHKWAAFPEHRDGALWGAFLAGWTEAQERTPEPVAPPILHERTETGWICCCGDHLEESEP